MPILKHDQNRYLIGPRVHLRALEPDDLKHLQPWFNDPELGSLLGRSHPWTQRTLEAWYRHFADMETGILFGVVDSNEKKQSIIGYALLDDICWPHRVAETVILVIGDKELRGHGRGTEVLLLLLRYAFGTLGLNRIECEILEYNTAAIDCAHRVGFQKEGEKRDARFVDGRFYTLECYGLLRSEYGEG